MSEPLTDAELEAFNSFVPALILGDKNRVLEAEIARLRVCGTCDHFVWRIYEEGSECELDSRGTDNTDHCRLSPSRWTPYWGEELHEPDGDTMTTRDMEE